MTAVMASVLVVLSSVPAVVNMIRRLEKAGDPLTLTLVLIAASAVILGVGLAVVAFQKLRLNRKVEKYNREIRGAFGKILDRTNDYSTYMSAIGSYTRGMSCLKLSERQKQQVAVVRNSKQKHVKAISIMLGKLQKWSKAFYLNVDFTTRRPEPRVQVSAILSAEDSRLYAFETGKSYEVELNRSGMTVLSPFSFASRLEIMREELYDD